MAERAWLASPFRPFYLLGAAYALPLTLAAPLAFVGLDWAAYFVAWHAHEMVFGFIVAIVTGTALTALPSWAGTEEIRGRWLAALVLLWLAGRLACAAAPWLSAPLVAAIDVALLPVLILRLAPQLLALPQRRWLLLLGVLAWLGLAHVAWHIAAAGDAGGAARALRSALWPVVALYTLAGGLLTPVFTAGVLAAAGRGAPEPPSPTLEVLALGSLVALAAFDIAAAPPAATAAAVLAALALQGLRVARWRGWRAAHDPLVAAMHLGFVWLLVALALKAAAALGAPLPEATWVHAFTIGALGTMMMSLTTRVALRHTGRALVAPPELPWLVALIGAAALLRIGAPLLGAWAMVAASLLWGACFVTWFVRHAAKLVTPSLPP